MHSALTCAYLAVKELSDGMESVGDLTNEQVDDLMKEATKIEEKAVRSAVSNVDFSNKIANQDKKFN